MIGWMPQPLTLIPLTPGTMRALLDRDLPAASAAAGVPLTDHFLTDRALWLWRYRLDQIEADPASAAWLVRIAFVQTEGVVVGHAGYHGPPDEHGMVEVGYSVDPAHRRQGYARAMLRALILRAAADPGVRTVRASIRPDNAASLGTIAGFGFTQVGEQLDDIDGLELIFERPARP